ncbi:MAG: 2-oxoglutarate oxidoreductase, partial [Candidatus Latescibacterota bacterium]
MKLLRAYRRPESLADVPFRYCPGCGHGIVTRLVAEVVDELGIRERTVGIAPVGCAVFLEEYFNFDMVGAAHGRAPAVATGLKRALPDHVILAYQGDGDLAAIGAAEILHAANRGERITVVYVNNAVYGMTRGQMAPTTLLGQKTTTTPSGRNPRRDGFPLRVCELLAGLDGAVYIARGTVTSPGNVRTVKRYIKRAIQAQMEDQGFSLVEVLSPCPSHWHMDPREAIAWVEE